jgi:hypothetical protein
MEMLNMLECNLPNDWQARLRQIGYSLWGSVAFVAVVLTLRGLAGAFRQEVSPLSAFVSAFVAAVLCAAALGFFRVGIPIGFTRTQSRFAVLMMVLPPTLIGVVLCPATSSLGVAWITLLAVAQTIAVHLVARPAESSRTLADEAGHSDAVPAILAPALEEPDLTQWMTRRTVLEAGETWEQIEGQSTVEFAAGQQHAAMHISMCPPMSVAPEIECEIQGEVSVEWKVAAVHPYGVRLELRRAAPAAAVSVAVGYTMAAIVQPNMAKAA